MKYGVVDGRQPVRIPDLAGDALKVPQVTAIFWLVKLLSTAMGEATSDYLVFHVNPYVAVVAGTVALVLSLIAQLSARRYVPAIYWTAVAMVAVFGTMAADVAHVVLGVPYLVSTLTFLVVLGLVFAFWYRHEGTLSIHTISRRSRELFYWATVIATFALGTAAGDMTAATLGLGYFPSLMLFAALFAAPLIVRRFFGLNETFSFWFAYVMTRPLGASFADWVGKPYLGGLGLGDGIVAVCLTLLIVAAIVHLTVPRSR